MEVPAPILLPDKQVCAFDGCERLMRARGYCHSHYEQHRHGRPLTSLAPYEYGRVCAFTDCEKKHAALGFCQGHYQQLKRGEVLHYLEVKAPRGSNMGRVCPIDGCARPVAARGLCAPHRRNERLFGTPIHPRPVAKPRVDAIGYVRLRGELQHRLIMEEILGRPLLPTESVHHKNGVRTDNRRRNLELWSSSHPSGQRVKDLVAWAKELLHLYEPEWAHR